MKKKLLVMSLILTIVLSGCSVTTSETETVEEITILHAGSLSVPFKEISEAFMKEYPKYRVLHESAGSRDTARKVTDLGRKVEIVASADYTVIEELMMPDYTDWYINFATNEMVIMYTENSKRSDEITQDNWYEILLDSSVEYGHSEPNADPCGYRSQLVWQLAENHYNIEGLYEKLQDNRPMENIRPKETFFSSLIDLVELYLIIFDTIYGIRNILNFNNYG